MEILSPAQGYADVVIGLQHGDEGKGRFIDELAQGYDWITRYNGGPNAGHTIEANGHRLALHQIPSGVNYPDKKLYIGAGCVVNIEKLCAEIDEVQSVGCQVMHRLRVAAQASVIQPGHIVRDLATMQSVGTTGNGIGATYSDKAARVAGCRQLDIRMGELLTNTEWAFAAIRRNFEVSLEQVPEDDTTTISLLRSVLHPEGREKEGVLTTEEVTQCMEHLRGCFERIKSCIEKDPSMLRREIRNGMRALFEGAQSYWLSLTHGITPDVTASDPGVAAAFNSLNVPVDYKRRAYGVAKLIPTRVGHGPFPTEFGGLRSEAHCMAERGKKNRQGVERELFGNLIPDLLQSQDDLDVGIALRIIGNEYGASTGRPRRPGRLDLVNLCDAVESNGLDGLYLTKADCLRDFARTHDSLIHVATGYKLNGDFLTYVPTTKTELQQVQPLFTPFPAFEKDVSLARTEGELPSELLCLLGAIRQQLGCSIIGLGVGPRREQVVHLNGF